MVFSARFAIVNPCQEIRSLLLRLSVFPASLKSGGRDLQAGNKVNSRMVTQGVGLGHFEDEPYFGFKIGKK